MTFALPNHQFGMTGVSYNLGVLPSVIPEQNALEAANKLNEHRYRNLTSKQRVFVDAYFGFGMDPVKAAMEAGFAEEEAPRAARKLMKRQEIKQAIEFAQQYYVEATKLRVETLVDELKLVALTNITDLIDPETVEIRHDIDADDLRWRAVKSIKRTENKFGTNVEYVMHDKMAAIDKLLKLLAPSSQGDGPGGDAGNTTNNVTNNVTQMVAIVPVPSGQFLPPPPSPYEQAGSTGLVIEHNSSALPDLQSGSPISPRASVPVERNG